MLFQLIWTFFGLNSKFLPEFRKLLFEKLHNIVFNSEKSYTFSEVYNFPIYLRNFIFNKLKQHHEGGKDSEDKFDRTKRNLQNLKLPKVKGGNPPPKLDYTTKRSKK